MRRRDSISGDFVFFQASSRCSEVRALLQAVKSRFVVVRSETAAGARYHVLLRVKLPPRLREPAAVAGPDDPPVGAILALDPAGAAATVAFGDLIRPADADRVVLDETGLVGVIPETRTTRAGLESFFGSPVDQAPSGPPTALSRNLSASLPSSVRAGEVVSLLVDLRADGDRPDPTSQVFATSRDSRVQVVVSPQKGFALEGAGDGTIVVTDPQSDHPLYFTLRAGDAGDGRVKVYAFHGGGSVDLTLHVTIGVGAVDPAALPADTRRIEFVERPPDLSIYVVEDRDALTFHVEAGDCAFSRTKLGSTTIGEHSRDYFRLFYREVEALETDTEEQRAAAREKLESMGNNLFEALLPADLRALLWELRTRVRTLQIMSHEPWIPWEFCRLQGTVDGRVEEGPFFAEAFSVTRWLMEVDRAPSLSLRRMALVVPNSNLRNAAVERDYLLTLRGSGREVTEVPATRNGVIAAMKAASYDAWHFTGHARADETLNSDQSTLLLNGRDVLVPEDVSGQVANMLAPRPMVFLNGCQTAPGGRALAGVGGWAQRFLRPRLLKRGAAAFIGSYWSIDDAAALLFGRTLYEHLLAGRPIGEAASLARRTVRDTGDPTWLAYTVYADPNATVASTEGVSDGS